MPCSLLLCFSLLLPYLLFFSPLCNTPLHSCFTSLHSAFLSSPLFSPFRSHVLLPSVLLCSPSLFSFSSPPLVSFCSFSPLLSALLLSFLPYLSSVDFVKWSSQGMLRMSPDAMNSLFKPTIDHIIQHLSKQC